MTKAELIKRLKKLQRSCTSDVMYGRIKRLIDDFEKDKEYVDSEIDQERDVERQLTKLEKPRKYRKGT